MEPKHLGIEIGGTKLQLGVGTGLDGQLETLVRADVDPLLGAKGILNQIAELGKPLREKFTPAAIGIGFGGPVDPVAGRVTTSHQIAGWDEFPLVKWAEETFGKKTSLGNDCDVAALAEALFGAGKFHDRVFYVTVGTGVGGGFVVDGKSDGAGRPAIAEIGHLRVGLGAGEMDGTVESFSSGRGIERAMRNRLRSPRPTDDLSEFLTACAGDLDSLTAKQIAQLAEEGNELALEVWQQAVETLGWGIAQMITLLAPNVVVVGGGVSLNSDSLFHTPLLHAIRQYVFPPLIGSYEIQPAMLGEDVVVHGALALAAMD